MDKIVKLQKQITDLENQKIKLDRNIEMIKNEISTINSDINKINYEVAQEYSNFFKEKTNKEFVLYEKYPNVNALELYVSWISNRFPLYDYGSFNAKEIAEVIKNLYQFKTDKEYKILTIGVAEVDGEPVYGGQVYSTIPHLYFMIGNDKSLEEFKEYDGKFVNSDKLHAHIYLYAHAKDLINLELKRDFDGNPSKIECITDFSVNKKGYINYYDGCRYDYTDCGFEQNKQIFSNNIKSNLHSSKVRGIKDVFDFKIDHRDSFISKVLTSIAIYKKNNNLEELSNEDYNHIFNVLYNEKVNIKEEVERDFPKQLQYVPSKRTGR